MRTALQAGKCNCGGQCSVVKPCALPCCTTVGGRCSQRQSMPPPRPRPPRLCVQPPRLLAEAVVVCAAWTGASPHPNLRLQTDTPCLSRTEHELQNQIRSYLGAGECESPRQTAFQELHTSIDANRADFRHAARTSNRAGDQGNACDFNWTDKVLRGVYMRAHVEKAANPGQSGMEY